MNGDSIDSFPTPIPRRFFWRFVFLFLLFYVVPYDIAYGFTYTTENWAIWHKPIIWIGETFFGWEFDLDRLYIGFDSKFEFCRYVFCISLAIIVSCVWMFIDAYLKKDYHKTFKVFVQTVLRYHIAIVILQYGLSKVLLLQFGTISISTLDTTFGELSPIGLMGSFFSFSETFSLFSGWMEVIGAILLLFRKTTYLGGVLLFVVMANVVLIDISYNVSVTLYAIQLLLLILVLLSSQLKSLYTFLVLNKAATPATYKSLFESTKYYKISFLLKGLLFLLIAFFTITKSKEYIENYKSNTTSWFTSKHTVETFIINNDTLVVDDSTHIKLWKTIVFNGYSYDPDSFEITHNDTLTTQYKFKIDSLTYSISYRPYEDDKADWSTLNYQKVGDREYIFRGVFNADTLQVKTTSKMLEDYTLMQTKGNWLFDLE